MSCDVGCEIGCEIGSDIDSDINGEVACNIGCKMGCNMGVNWQVNTGRIMDSKVSDKIGRGGIIDGGDYPMRPCPFDAPRRCA